jgi:hypothetical protein
MVLKSRCWAGSAALAIVLFTVTGCGGGSAAGARTYVEEPVNDGVPSGIYVTVVSPVPIPGDLLTHKTARIVAEAKGPQACSATKTVHGGHGHAAFLNGRSLTIRVNGSNPEVSIICAILKKGTINVNKLAGG